jgi:hypothetical protein
MSSVHFVLTTLESSVQMGLAAAVETSVIDALDVSATAVFQVSVDSMKQLFKYQTDSNDVTDLDATDIKYFVDSAAWPQLNPANAMLDAPESSGPIASAGIEANKQLVAHDFVRYLALKLFNTYRGVDLFNNEIELLTNLREICDDSAAGHTMHDINSKVQKVSLSGTHADIQGEAGAKYMTNANQTAENIGRVIMQQMTNSAISRFSTLEDADANDRRSLPFQPDDSISFKVTINPADGQEELTSVSEFGGRSYEIRLVLVDGTPANTEVAADEL